MLLSTSPMEEEKVFIVQPAGETRIKNVLTVRSWGTHGGYAVCNCLSIIDASVAQPLHPRHHKAIFLGAFLRVHLVRSWRATPCRKVGRPFYPVYAHLGYCTMHMNTASKTVM